MLWWDRMEWVRNWLSLVLLMVFLTEQTRILTVLLFYSCFQPGKTTLMNAITNGKIDGWPQHLKTAYVDSGSNVDPLYEAQIVIDHIVSSTGQSKESCVAKLKELDFTDAMLEGSIGALSGGWQMKMRLVRAVLMQPDIYLLDEPTNVRCVRVCEPTNCFIF